VLPNPISKWGFIFIRCSMKSILPLIFLLVTIRILGQDISVSGSITNHQLQPIESALVVVKNQNNHVLGYTYSNEKGVYLLEFETDTVQSYIIEVSSLGYAAIKKEVEINKPTQNINFKMKEQM